MNRSFNKRNLASICVGVVAAFAALSVVGWTQLALADVGGVKGHTKVEEHLPVTL